jgi:hypothetical protein
VYNKNVNIMLFSRKMLAMFRTTLNNLMMWLYYRKILDAGGLLM